MIPHALEQEPDFEADFAEAMRRCAEALTEAGHPEAKAKIPTAVRVAAIAVDAVVIERELGHRPDAALEIFVNGLKEQGGYGENARITDAVTWHMMMRRANSELVTTQPEAARNYRTILRALLNNQGAHFDIGRSNRQQS